ncbi:MAG: Fpg/Nei family DNA glycosylase [Sandaracinaceae bacterium]
MPELPDVQLYLDAIGARTIGHALTKVRLASPFLLRSVEPPIQAIEGRIVEGLRRIGKRIVFDLGDAHFAVIHLMIAGRFRWSDEPGAKIPGRVGLMAMDFDTGTLILTEASKKKRAALHIVEGEDALAEHDRGGAEPLETDLDGFRNALTRERHTLKRSLTDQRLLSGIGNAYSDEILHRAKLSPMKRSDHLKEEEMLRLFEATKEVLSEWCERLKEETGDAFPTKVTAFRPEMAVHGKYKEPCPVCEHKVMRIRYASNEANYCPTCQTGGKLLADRSLSRLLKKSWPKTLEELEGGR